MNTQDSPLRPSRCFLFLGAALMLASACIAPEPYEQLGEAADTMLLDCNSTGDAAVSFKYKDGNIHQVERSTWKDCKEAACPTYTAEQWEDLKARIIDEGKKEAKRRLTNHDCEEGCGDPSFENLVVDVVIQSEDMPEHVTRPDCYENDYDQWEKVCEHWTETKIEGSVDITCGPATSDTGGSGGDSSGSGTTGGGGTGGTGGSGGY